MSDACAATNYWLLTFAIAAGVIAIVAILYAMWATARGEIE